MTAYVCCAQSGGWLRTGDVGFMDARGGLWLCGRRKARKALQLCSRCAGLPCGRSAALCARAQDVVKSGGENVHAGEVEAALASHVAVAGAAVVALPDARLGEAVAALVVLRPGVRWVGPRAGTAVDSEGDAAAAAVGDVTPAALREHCRSVVGLAGFKLPRLVAATVAGEPLPANASGKVLKEQVRAMLLPLARHDSSSAPRRSRL